MLVDTSIWIEHLRRNSHALAGALESGLVWCHPMIIGELACGSLGNRAEILDSLQSLPQGRVATDDEVMALIETRRLHGRGLGWVDMHLVASALLSHVMLWTRDARLGRVAGELGVAP